MYIQCFVEKSDGSDVFVDFEGVRYIFTKNQLDHAVCFVGNQAHQRRLLSSGPGAYIEYIPPDVEDPSFQPGAQAVPLGGQQLKREPEATEPLPDNLTVDESLTTTDEGAAAPQATVETQEAPKADPPIEDTAPIEVEWAPEAIDTKIKEFRYLDTDNFKSFVEANRDRVMGWPKEIRTEIARKLNKKLPDLDPGIEGFVINDYLGSGNTVDP